MCIYIYIYMRVCVCVSTLKPTVEPRSLQRPATTLPDTTGTHSSHKLQGRIFVLSNQVLMFVDAFKRTRVLVSQSLTSPTHWIPQVLDPEFR